MSFENPHKTWKPNMCVCEECYSDLLRSIRVTVKCNSAGHCTQTGVCHQPSPSTCGCYTGQLTSQLFLVQAGSSIWCHWPRNAPKNFPQKWQLKNSQHSTWTAHGDRENAFNRADDTSLCSDNNYPSEIRKNFHFLLCFWCLWTLRFSHTKHRVHAHTHTHTKHTHKTHHTHIQNTHHTHIKHTTHTKHCTHTHKTHTAHTQNTLHTHKHYAHRERHPKHTTHTKQTAHTHKQTDTHTHTHKHTLHRERETQNILHTHKQTHTHTHTHTQNTLHTLHTERERDKTHFTHTDTHRHTQSTHTHTHTIFTVLLIK